MVKACGHGAVACALERYRLANGEYPETLDALQPRFIETLPHDVIGGQPLKYHPTDNGQFALYSVGWNGTDDGGAVFRRNPWNMAMKVVKATGFGRVRSWAASNRQQARPVE